MKQFSRIVAVAILMSLWIPPAGGSGEERLGTPPRVAVSLLLLEAPSIVETSTDLASVGTIIVHQSQLTPGRTVYLEAWCQTPSSNGISTAVLDLEYDTRFLDTSLAQVVLAPQWDLLHFVVFVDDVVGLIDDFGGNNLSGLGSAPNWAKVGAIEFDVTSTPSDAVLFCSSFAGTFLKFAIKAEGSVDPDDVSYGCFLAGCSSGVDCNDGNPCTDDSCDAASGCVNVSNTTPCDDGEICTSNDTCADGVCVGGSPSDCDDGNVCTTNSCDLAIGCINAPVDNGTPCPNDAFCDGEETCQGGVCADESDPCSDLAHCDEGRDSCLECINSEECDDGNPCTVGVCVFGGTCTYLNNSGPCSDDDACTINDSCAGGICVGGPPLECDDNKECTNDSCDPASGCVNTNLPAGTACGDPSDTTCDNPDTCDGSGSCQDNFERTTTTCDDVLFCTSTSTVPGDVDNCNGAGACVGNPVLCDDGQFCTGDETCNEDTDSCDSSGDPCPGTECNTCQEDTDSCFDPTGTPCGDPTDTVCDKPDNCDGNGTCLDNYEPQGTPCVDEFFCNGEEACDDAGICQTGTGPCTDPWLPFCDENINECVECLKIGDPNGDGTVDLQDFAAFAGVEGCQTGPGGPVDPPMYAPECRCLDADDDGDIDLVDFAYFQRSFSG